MVNYCFKEVVALMILTREYLEEYQRNMFISIPENICQELLKELGEVTVDDNGNYRDFTEQDICQQIENKLKERGIKR